MFALISPLISLFAGGLPRLLDIWQSSKDQKHEVTMAQLQIQAQLEAQKAGFKSQERIEEIRLDEIKVQSEADIEKAEIEAHQAHRTALYQHDAKLMERSATWVVTLSASVRPVVTYLFVFELIGINIASLWMAWASGLINDYQSFKVIMDEIFTATEMVMVTDIVFFWFGTKAFGKKS
jgi:hypothetical protein